MAHLTIEQLRAGLATLPESPADGGTLEMIVVRTDEDERDTPASVSLDIEGGVEADYWGRTRSSRENQVSLINRHLVDLVADGEQDRWALAGDNLVVDLDIGVENLPAGTRLAVGSAVIEVTPQPHRGCSHFAARYGIDAQRFVNSEGEGRRLRGVYAQVIQGGTVDVGSVIKKV